MRRRLLVLLALCFIFVSADARPRKAINSFKKLRTNETVVVGRVELVPSLHEHEQQLRGPMSRKYENKMFLIIDAENWELTEEPGFGDFKGRIDEVRISSTVRYTGDFQPPTKAFQPDPKTVALWHLDK